eukprot:352088-Chlamydomonas_euryale.AAC.4
MNPEPLVRRPAHLRLSRQKASAAGALHTNFQPHQSSGPHRSGAPVWLLSFRGTTSALCHRSFYLTWPGCPVAILPSAPDSIQGPDYASAACAMQLALYARLSRHVSPKCPQR